MKLTLSVLNDAPIIRNAMGETTLCLRGLGIPQIENLSHLLIQYRALDLTNNDLLELNNVPELTELETLLLGENSIMTILQLFVKLRNLKHVSLMNNKIGKLEHLDQLKEASSLTDLVLTGNQVTSLENYRPYVVNLIPSLKVLDFKRVTMKERQLAQELFGEKDSKDN